MVIDIVAYSHLYIYNLTKMRNCVILKANKYSYIPFCIIRNSNKNMKIYVGYGSSFTIKYREILMSDLFIDIVMNYNFRH